MSFSKLAAITTLLGTVSMVAAHGYVSGIVVDGQYYSGYIVTQFPYESNPPAVIAWSTTATDLGYVDGTSYSSGDIICHKSAKPGALTAPVTAGSKIEFQWNTWPESHHGPVIDYLAPCNGNCSDVDKTTLEFFKIDQGGLVSDTTLPGTWASDQLISNNNSWTVTIPSTIAPGNYVLRHEIIALHSAGNKDGAQNYPQCINIQVTGSGTDSPSGTLGTSLYTDTDPGILINIYQTLSSYIIPGPTLYAGGSSSGSSSVAATSKATTSTAAASTATAKATTAKASTATSSTATVTTAVAKVTSSTATVTDATTVQTTTTKKVAAQTTATTATTVAAVTSAATSATTSAATQAATTATTTASAALPTGSALTDYLNSLSADDVLTLIRGTMSWLITSKNHARDLSARAARAM